jgi:hypothetical protein
MRLKKKHGGCDLGVQEDIAWASFVSSFEESIGSVVELLPNIFPVGEVDQLYVRSLVHTTEGPDDKPVPPRPSTPTEALRERKNLQHTYSVAMEKTRIADLVNELRADPERMLDLIRRL